jgi:hypothetical protein
MIGHGLKTIGDNYSQEDLEQICIDVLATKIGYPKELLKQSDLIKATIHEIHGDA